MFIDISRPRRIRNISRRYDKFQFIKKVVFMFLREENWNRIHSLVKRGVFFWSQARNLENKWQRNITSKKANMYWWVPYHVKSDSVSIGKCKGSAIHLKLVQAYIRSYQMNTRKKITGILKSENGLQKILESFIFIRGSALGGSRSKFTFHSGVYRQCPAKKGLIQAAINDQMLTGQGALYKRTRRGEWGSKSKTH